jgi:hypothetical protein
VDDLEVDGELAALVVENQDADAAAARLEGAGQTGPQVGLVNDLQVLLDIAGLSHGDNVAVLEVEDAVLLEDRAEHGLDDDAGGRVGDEGGLLVQLLGEEVDTKVAVLAGGTRGGDADDLARAALEDEEVAEADVVAGNGHRVGDVTLTARGAAGRSGSRGLLAVDVDVDVGLMTAVAGHLVGELVDALTEGVVVAVFVVVSHLRLLVGAAVAGGLNRVFLDSHFTVGGRARDRGVNGELVGVDGLGLVARLRGDGVYGGVVGRTETLAVFALSDVNGAGVGLGGVGVDVDVNVSVVILTDGGTSNRTLFGVDVGVLVVLGLETGTVVAFLVAGDADLFFVAVLLLAGGGTMSAWAE